MDLKVCQRLNSKSLTSTQLSQDNSSFCSTDILKMQILITQKYPNSGLKVKLKDQHLWKRQQSWQVVTSY